jgi:hypothetical protein
MGRTGENILNSPIPRFSGSPVHRSLNSSAEYF